MSEGNDIETVIEHLVGQAAGKYSSDVFTLMASRTLGYMGIRFRVPHGTAAKRPAPRRPTSGPTDGK